MDRAQDPRPAPRWLALVAVAVRRRRRDDGGHEEAPSEVPAAGPVAFDGGPHAVAEEPVYLPLGRGVGVPEGASIYLPLGNGARAGGTEAPGLDLVP